MSFLFNYSLLFPLHLLFFLGGYTKFVGARLFLGGSLVRCVVIIEGCIEMGGDIKSGRFTI